MLTRIAPLTILVVVLLSVLVTPSQDARADGLIVVHSMIFSDTFICN